MDYKVAVSNMPSRELRAFAVKAAETLEVLECQNAQLRDDLDTALTVDLDVIKNWRGWCETLDQERDKWSKTATRLSVENTELQEQISQLEGTILTTIETLKNIIDRTNAAASAPKGKEPQLRTGLADIRKLAKDSSERLERLGLETRDDEEPATPELTAEPSSDAKS